MIDGFYQIAFTGTAGSGFGMLVLLNGAVAGADVAGGTYDGTYTEKAEIGEVSLQITMLAPAGVTLVQTGIALTSPMSMPISATFTRKETESGQIVLLHTPLGPVNVLFKKIRDISS